jgi:TolB-like protein/DNA-binding winged helix-turn-helix (wHTH) protein
MRRPHTEPAMAREAWTTNTRGLTPDPSGYQVADLIVELAARRVRRAGTVIRLQALSFDLLATLVRAAPNVVSFEQLNERVWPGLVITPETIVQRVKLVRDALGDDPHTPRYIEGVRGRGYRMVAEVRALTETREEESPAVHAGIVSAGVAASSPASALSASPRPGRRVPLGWIGGSLIIVALLGASWALVYHRGAGKPAERASSGTASAASQPAAGDLPAPGAASLSPAHSIVVLPFLDMSEKKDQEYFSDGLSEELIALLGKTRGLRVIPRTSSFYFKGRAETLEEIAAKLRVANVLEGSVRRSGTRLRVTAQLIRADTSEQLWSETYDRDLHDVFKVQDEIAGAVVAALQLKLAAGQQGASSYRTSNPEAHNHYLLGRQFFERGTIDGFRRAAEAYRKAVDLDPNYAAAYAGLAVASSYAADQTGDTAEQEAAMAAAEKAVALAPGEAGGYAVRGYMRLRRTWDWSGAKSDFEKALTLDADDSTLQWQYAALQGALGRMPEAVAAARKATELDPLSAAAWTFSSLYLIESRQFAAAHDAVGRLFEIAPQAPQALDYMAFLQLLEGHASQARDTFGQLKDLAGIAMAEHTLGHPKESQQALDQYLAIAGDAGAYGLAEIYAWRGERDKAFKWLDRAYQQHNSDFYDFRNDVAITLLRGDPRFGAMLRKMKLPE